MDSKKNLFSWIDGEGNDKNFEPNVEASEVAEDFAATDAPAGSNEKLRIMAARVEMGMPLWHPEDPSDAVFSGGLIEDDD